MGTDHAGNIRIRGLTNNHSVKLDMPHNRQFSTDRSF